MKKPFLSPSAVGNFISCPRCFWRDKVQKIAKPRGPFPTLPGGIDDTMKRHHDSVRGLGLTPDMLNELPGGVSLFGDISKLERWRNWRSGLKVEAANFVVGGALDDLIVESGPAFSPYDYKSRKDECDRDYIEKWYLHQADIYAFMLEHNGMKSSGHAYFRVVWPVHDTACYDGIRFAGKFITVDTDLARADVLLNRAAACISSPVPPESSEGCEFCGFVSRVQETGL